MRFLGDLGRKIAAVLSNEDREVVYLFQRLDVHLFAAV